MLEALKGNKSWDAFLRELLAEFLRLRRIEVARRYLEERPMSDEEAREMLRMIEEGRRSWVERC